jgi:hypothetical protein
MSEDDNKHNDGANSREDFELTPSEKEALERLPRSRTPNAALEERVVRVLRDRGVLAPRRRRVIELTVPRIAAAAAACLLLLAVGFVFGRSVSARNVTSGVYVVNGSSDRSVAAALQQTGSAYLLALQRLAELPDTVDSDQAVQGREVALMTLYTAADQVTRLVPKNQLAGQLLAAIDTGPAMQTIGRSGSAAIESNKVIEF